MFKWPNVFDIWNTYLSEFLARYGGSKLERTRDLFEQCLDGCPEKFAKNFYLLYAKLEEEHGMARHAMAVYDRAVLAVEKKEQAEVYNVYLRKAAEIYGVTRTRQIYEKAIEVLHDHDVREMLRIKRSVAHTYNTSVNMMSAQMLSSGPSGTVSDLAPGMKDDMRMLEAKAAEMNA